MKYNLCLSSYDRLIQKVNSVVSSKELKIVETCIYIQTTSQTEDLIIIEIIVIRDDKAVCDCM
jgi:hypothetical protein